ncbi:S-adenosyl-L-methionine-dependent methyltransferase [Ramaria rubella]|nr:S-adenosyl-L-methionine-dependent methyltransferase [Ramaria rubella]
MLTIGLRHCCSRIRFYSTSNIPPLPPISEWRSTFYTAHRYRRARVCLSNPQTSEGVAESFLPPKESEEKGKVIIEAFPGPGALTRALLELPPSRMRKLVVLEDVPEYFQKVKELELADPRIKVLDMNAMSWDTYDQLEQGDLLTDVDVKNWEDDADLEFICHIPHSILGEQFVAQLLRSIPERSWLFKFGRMRMNLIMAESLYKRIDSPLKKKERCKLSVIAEATTNFRQPLPSRQLKPYDNHFWPPTPANRHTLPESRKPGHPMVTATFLPLKKQIIQPTMLDKWDYCLRRLFVLKITELRKALPSLAPGANNMLQYLEGPNVSPNDQLDTKTLINELTVDQWAKVVGAFDKWPFAPDMLYIQESIQDVRK